ncbi:hypothetical protein K505DRAFT_91593 [Melanomma pulvis-pyrius CBS 109.77]|uniref:Uncharacterized protein n=1 Tax=Melanomma pulvis-pyrius CBS 109.77 TaxID=1314802 RepID=A0A6A6WZR9_9PLEO|nr:hypothetical protein K505DRAFT_91593 [Melanomma pulvis-pyrius CBS 109.77]
MGHEDWEWWGGGGVVQAGERALNSNAHACRFYKQRLVANTELQQHTISDIQDVNAVEGLGSVETRSEGDIQPRRVTATGEQSAKEIIKQTRVSTESVLVLGQLQPSADVPPNCIALDRHHLVLGLERREEHSRVEEAI